MRKLVKRAKDLKTELSRIGEEDTRVQCLVEFTKRRLAWKCENCDAWYVDPGDDSDVCEVCDAQFCKKCVALHVELCKIKDM